MQNDNDHSLEGFLARQLKNFDKPLGVRFLQFDRTIAIKDQTDDSEKMGQVQARRYLAESGAHALIWGSVWTSNGKSDAQLYYTTSQVSSASQQAYQPQDFKLPDVNRRELTDVLGLVVATQSAEFSNQRGRFIADRLGPFLERVRRLLEGAQGQGWTAKDVAPVQSIFAHALTTFGEQTGKIEPLQEAVAAYRTALPEFKREGVLRKWAKTQGSLGVALTILGQREVGTTHLQEAVAAFQVALREFERQGDTLDSAKTQASLGNVLAILGRRESDPKHLHEAVTAFRAALPEFERQRDALDWAATQNNLGLVLCDFGEGEPKPKHLQEAVTAFRAALLDRTRQRVAQLDWAATQNNLGIALTGLGKREGAPSICRRRRPPFAPRCWNARGSGCHWTGPRLRTTSAWRCGLSASAESGLEHLRRSGSGLRAALLECTHERVPMDWAGTQNNLGIALIDLGETLRAGAFEHLNEAVTELRAALIERTHDRVPMDWAMTQNNLGIALSDLGERESSPQHLDEAVAHLSRRFDRVHARAGAVQWALASAISA